MSVFSLKGFAVMYLVFERLHSQLLATGYCPLWSPRLGLGHGAGVETARRRRREDIERLVRLGLPADEFYLDSCLGIARRCSAIDRLRTNYWPNSTAIAPIDAATWRQRLKGSDFRLPQLNQPGADLTIYAKVYPGQSQVCSVAAWHDFTLELLDELDAFLRRAVAANQWVLC